MKTLRFIIILLFIMATLVGLVYTISTSESRIIENKCLSLQYRIDTNSGTQYVHDKDIEKILKQHKLFPIDHHFQDINLQKIETILSSELMVNKVSCYLSPNGVLSIYVRQQQALFRIMTPYDSYYIDNQRNRMSLIPNHASHVLIVSGQVTEHFARNELFDFIEYIRDDAFLNALVQQIVVTSNEHIELIPRIEHTRIILGSLQRYEKKLEKLSKYYDKVTPKMGWDNYSKINLQYVNQIVCTKK